jgi:hypothetical protein
LKSAAFFIGAYCKEFSGGCGLFLYFELTQCVLIQRTLCFARRKAESLVTV